MTTGSDASSIGSALTVQSLTLESPETRLPGLPRTAMFRWLYSDFRGIRCRVIPIVWRHDLGFDACVFAEQVEQVRAVDQLDRLVLGEVEARLAVAGGGDEDSLAGAFVLQRAKQVPYCRDPDGVLVAL